MLKIHSLILGAFVIALALPTQIWSLRHPGILHSNEELGVLKEKVQAGVQPWKKAYDQMKASGFASLAYTPRPFLSVDCGSYNNPNHGCNEIHDDGAAAYTHALMWAMTGNKNHADKSKAIIKAWADTYQKNTLSNSRLVVAWSAPFYTNAAEILRYTNSGWLDTDTELFNSLLDKFMPYLKSEAPPENNWIQSIIEAQMAIAIFQDNTQELDMAVKRWQNYLPMYIYQKSDGIFPIKATWRTDSQVAQIWQAPLGQNVLVEGQAMETCRDLGHLGLGFGSLIYAAETAWKQGYDLFAPNKKRLTDFMELHGSWMTGTVQVPKTICEGVVKTNQNNTVGINAPGGGGSQAWEIAFNHLGTRLANPLPFTQKMLGAKSPTPLSGWVRKWESLTHAGLEPKPYFTKLASDPKPMKSRSKKGTALHFFEGQWLLFDQNQSRTSILDMRGKAIFPILRVW